MSGLIRPARAKQSEGVVVIAAAETTPILRRLQQEIEALGFSVQLESHLFAEHPPPTLSSVGVVAAVEVATNAPGSISLYVLEPRTGRVIRQELPIDAPNDPTSTELVTTRSIELLRAARLEVDGRSNQPAPAPTPAPPPHVLAAPRYAGTPPAPTPHHGELQLGIGLGTLYVPHWQSGAVIAISATYLGADALGFTAAAFGTVIPLQATATDIGRVEAASTSLRLGTVAQIFRHAPFSVRVSLGLELGLNRFTGEVSEPYVGTSVYRECVAPWVAVGAALRLSSRLGMLTQISGAWSTPRTVVRAYGQELQDWGRPALQGTLNLEWKAL